MSFSVTPFGHFKAAKSNLYSTPSLRKLPADKRKAFEDLLAGDSHGRLIAATRKLNAARPATDIDPQEIGSGYFTYANINRLMDAKQLPVTPQFTLDDWKALYANANKEAAARPGLWANIHAKRKRGEKPAKPGDKDYPKAKAWQATVSSEKKAAWTPDDWFAYVGGPLLSTVGYGAAGAGAGALLHPALETIFPEKDQSPEAKRKRILTTMGLGGTAAGLRGLIYSARNAAEHYSRQKQARCWEGYEPVPGKTPYSEGSCRPKSTAKKKSKQPAATKQAANPNIDWRTIALAGLVPPTLGLAAHSVIHPTLEHIWPHKSKADKYRSYALGGGMAALGGSLKGAWDAMREYRYQLGQKSAAADPCEVVLTKLQLLKQKHGCE